MNVLLKGGEELGQIEATLTDLKGRHTELEQQLNVARGSVTKDANEPVEMSVKRYLKSWYKSDGIPHASRPDPKVLEIELEAVGESIARLRAIRLEAKSRRDIEVTQALLPGYLKAIVKLRESVDVAVAANAAVLSIERELSGQACSRGWNALDLLWWAHAMPLKDWREMTQAYIASPKHKSG